MQSYKRRNNYLNEQIEIYSMGSKRRLYIFVVFFAILFIGGVASAADPGHGADVVAAGTFESGNYIFPSNLNVTTNFSIGSFFVINPSLSRVGIGTLVPRQALTVAGNISASDTINATKLCIGTDCKSAWSAVGTGNVSGDGTARYIPQWRTGAVLNKSLIFQKGSNIGIGTSSPGQTLNVIGTLNVTNGSSTLGLFQAANGRVGIGTAAPGYVLDVNGNVGITGDLLANNGQFQSGNLTLGLDSTDGFLKTDSGNLLLISGSGKVGIGTTSPNNALTVAGDVNVSAASIATLYINKGLSGTIDIGSGTSGSSLISGSASNGHLTINATNTAGGDIILAESSSELIRLTGGKVGIGTASPAHTLTVAGTFNTTNNAFLASNLTVDATDFFVNANTGRVGIGTATPTHTLNVIGNSNFTGNITIDSTDFFVNANTGRVAVGTADPRQALTVAGNISASDTINATKLCIGTDCKSAWSAVGTGNVSGDGTASYIPQWRTGAVLNNSLIFQKGSNIGIGTSSPGQTLNVIGTLNVTNGSSTLGLFQAANGRVGIGTAAPGYVLDVNGNVGITGDLLANNGQFQSGNLTLGLDSTDGFLKTDSGNLLLISGSGKVGIGTTSPNNALTVAGDVNVSAASIATLYINKGLSGTIDIGSGTSGSSLISGSASNGHLTINATNTAGGDIILAESSSELIRLTGGKVGIGTASPAQKLTVIGNISGTDTVNATKLCIGNDCKSAWPSAGTGNVSGDGTAGYIPLWRTGSVINSSGIKWSGGNINTPLDASTSLFIGNVTVANIGTSQLGIGRDVYLDANGDTASGVGSNIIVVGGDAVVFGVSSFADSAPGGGSGSAVSFGADTNATGVGATAFGNSAKALAGDSVSLGHSTVANNTNAVAVGYNARANGTSSFAGGSSVFASKPNSVVLGASSNVTGGNSVVIGISSTSGSTSGIAIGDRARTLGTVDSIGAIAIGLNTSAGEGAEGSSAYAIGENALALVTWDVAIGYNTRALGGSSVST